MIQPDEPSSARIQTVSLAVLAVVAVTFSIYWLRPVLVPLVVALFVVSGVSPILNALKRRLGVNRIIAAGITFLAGVALLLVFGFSIWLSMVDLNKNSRNYRNRVEEIVDWAELHVQSFGQRIGTRTASVRPSQDATQPMPEAPVPVAADRSSKGDASDFVDAFVRDGISILSQALISLVSTSVVVLIYVFFLLSGKTVRYKSPMISEIDEQVRSYLGLKTLISIFTGFAFGISLWMFGVPMAFTFGVLAFLLNFVPNVGPLIASLLPIPLIILDPTGSIGWMVAAISVSCAIQAISGNVIEPKIMGDSSDLHPVTILVALMFWGMMWGIIGMFLATPVTAALKILLQRIDSTKPIADLMAGRFPSDDDTESSSAMV
ncbi:AI-2 transport protein TqsA [Novipirellula aureliae]|uniref:AI-2 transport protein TqsA n=1 Tax=Novipirellula aureliae TaxID=2527966 RepID=A0A5C6EAL2_9BACT|nr:AI-2E family transporter [Novipirellula aureliae]TWU44189.1 AI-2 transport protein TqsA [Novipirellula aureliae]